MSQLWWQHNKVMGESIEEPYVVHNQVSVTLGQVPHHTWPGSTSHLAKSLSHLAQSVTLGQVFVTLGQVSVTLGQVPCHTQPGSTSHLARPLSHFAHLCDTWLGLCHTWPSSTSHLAKSFSHLAKSFSHLARSLLHLTHLIPPFPPLDILYDFLHLKSLNKSSPPI